MSAQARLALKIGLLIGVINLVWLYLAYFLGLHTNGVMIFQVFMLVWLCITTIGFIVGLRKLKRAGPPWNYRRGVALGCLAAVVTAIVAVVAQIGYYTVVHPAWPDVMAEQTREFFANQGLAGDELEEKVAGARESFTLGRYATQSAIAAIALGTVVSAVTMIFLRKPNRSLSDDTPAEQ